MSGTGFIDYFLQQLVNGHTRLNNTLDLVLTNELQVNDELRILASPQTACKRYINVLSQVDGRPPVLTAISQSNGNGQTSTHHRIKTL